MKIFLDTNVAIDILSQREPHFEDSFGLFNKALKSKHSIWVSGLSIGTISYTVQKVLGRESTTKGIGKFLNHITVSAVNDSVVRLAHQADWKDFEDAIQYYSALDANCKMIVTRNKKDFEEQKIPVLSPKYALDFIKENS